MYVNIYIYISIFLYRGCETQQAVDELHAQLIDAEGARTQVVSYCINALNCCVHYLCLS
jgi:hypothetical protein